MYKSWMINAGCGILVDVQAVIVQVNLSYLLAGDVIG